MNRATLLAQVAAGRDRLAAALAGLADDAMLDPVGDGWTRKDVLAHLETWERRVVDDFALVRRGTVPDRSVETDDLNDRELRANRHRSLADVRAGERAAWDAVVDAIREASDEELFDSHHFAWTDGDPFADWFRGNTDEHVEEHLEQLTRPRALGVAELDG
jgi:hypothetical protein